MAERDRPQRGLHGGGSVKRIAFIVGALLAIVITVAVLRRPTTVEPNSLTPTTGPAAGARTLDLGDGWFADVSPDGDLSCVTLRNDAAQTRCLAVSTMVGGSQIWASAGQGLRVTVAFVGSADELTAVWSSKDQSGGPCCRGTDPMVEILPDVWLAHFATSDDDEHWGLQLRRLDGGLYEEHSLLPG